MNGAGPVALNETEFRCFSQTGEDGILHYIFSLIGETDKRCIEICAGDGTECNTANLLINHDWTGMLVDGDRVNVERGTRFFAEAIRSEWKPQFVQRWITRENVEGLITDHGFEGDMDLLSLDIDGNDYWVWQAIECVRPRVVAIEFNYLVEAPLSIPYDPQFSVRAVNSGGWLYYGASLSALEELARAKGYRLVGTTRNFVNAFFVRNGVGEDVLPAAASATLLSHPRVQDARRRHWPSIKDRTWVHIS